MEGRLSAELGTDAVTATTIRADAFPVYYIGSEKTGRGLATGKGKTSWWKLLGITPSTTIYVNNPAAFILTDKDQSVPFLMQR
jgi:hypothetical protein